jgi:rubrerythrin
MFIVKYFTGKIKSWLRRKFEDFIVRVRVKMSEDRLFREYMEDLQAELDREDHNFDSMYYVTNAVMQYEVNNEVNKQDKTMSKEEFMRKGLYK